MAVLLPIFIGLIVALLSYWWIKQKRIRDKLKWIPEVPSMPLLGNVLELKKSTEILEVLSKYSKKYDGLCTIQLLWDKYIVATNPEFLEFLLGKFDILDKSDEYKYLSRWLGNGILIADAPTWKKSRKMLTPAFHFSILENFIEIFNTNSDILVELLGKEVGKDSFDVFPYVTMAALDIICETTMGISINAQKQPKSDYIESIKEQTRSQIRRTYSPIQRFDTLYPLTKDYYDQAKNIKTLHAYTFEVINKRKQELEKNIIKGVKSNNEDDFGIKKKKVLLDLLLETTIDGKPLSPDEIRQEVDTFLFAGHDTTSSSTSFTLYCLSTNPEVQKKAVEEQNRIFGDDKQRHATLGDLQEMKYLDMVIKEALRMYPPVPYIGRVANQDVPYKDGKIIPEGTGILVIIFSANRNPKYFTDPDTFNPSRFDENKNYSQYVYLPFSAGPRNCIGQKYALLEMKVMLSKILRNYEIHPSGKDLVLAAEVVLKSLNGINIKLKKREP